MTAISDEWQGQRRAGLTGMGAVMVLAALLGACTPTVQVAAPKEPITINLNIKLDADVRVRLEEAAKKDIQTNPGIF
ncbi:MAG: YnbE family lipoprotein [Minwuia sp.]|nr:YnbE family lipoprotein [Minwuia sp.]